MSEPGSGPKEDLHCEVCGQLMDGEEERESHMKQEHGAPGGQLATQDNLAGGQARD
jgi:hypothetical protein